MDDQYGSNGSFFVTGGAVRPDAPSYVERQCDQHLLQTLRLGQFCYVLTSRQMGKTSLVVHTAQKLRQEEVAVVVWDLTAIGQNITPEKWFGGLCVRMSDQLDREDELDEFWKNHSNLGPCQRLFAAIREVVLPHVNHLAVFVDEIDMVRSLPFPTDEFFAAVRECYNRRAVDPTLQRVTFCLLGVATPSDLIRDTYMTPFNIGQRIELHDFTIEEAAPLARGFELKDAQGSRLLKKILRWTRGHPYLTQRLCQELAKKKKVPGVANVDQICQDLFLSPRAKEKDDNLIFVRERLLRSQDDPEDILSLYRSVLSGRAKIADDESNPLVSLLRLSGVVRAEKGRLLLRNQIYERAFNRAWIDNNMPDAALRRQQEAYRKGQRKAACVSAGIILVMAILVVSALWSRNLAKEATWNALLDQARFSRVSGLAGQRFKALNAIGQAAQIKVTPELRDEAIACLALPDLRREPIGIPYPGDAEALVFSQDLRQFSFSDPEGNVVLGSVQNSQERSQWKTGAKAADRLWLSPNNHFLAVAHGVEDATLLSFWRCASKEALFSQTNQMMHGAFDFSPDGRLAALGTKDGLVKIVDLPDGELRMEIDIGLPCSVLRFAPGGGRLAVGSSESLKIGIYHVVNGSLSKTLHCPSPPELLAWHPHGQLLAGVGQDQRIRLWEVDADEFAKAELASRPSRITDLTFNHSGSLLASAAEDQSLRLWDPGRGILLVTLSGAPHVRQLQFSPDDHRLGFEISGGKIYFWEVEPGDECRSLVDFKADEIRAFDIHPEGRLLATGHLNGVSLWDMARSRIVRRMAVGKTAALRIHPRSGDMVTCEFRGTFCYSLNHREEEDLQKWILKPQDDFYLGPGATALALSRNAQVHAVAYDDRIRLVSNTNAFFSLLEGWVGEAGFQSIALSPDGGRIAAANWEAREIWIWDRDSGATPQRIPVKGAAHLQVSPEGKWLAAVTENSCVLWLWDRKVSLEPPVRIERLPEATRPIPVAFSANGNWMAMAISDTRVRLFNRSWKTIADLESPHKEPLVGLAFNQEDSQLVCATANRIVLVWDLNLLVRGLKQLALEVDLPLTMTRLPSEPLMVLEIEELDRLQFSKIKPVFELRRNIGELNDLIRKEPEAWHFYRYRAEAYRDLGEFEKSVMDYHRWLELGTKVGLNWDPKFKAWPYRDLALVHLSGTPDVRDYDKARALTEQALKLDPDNPDNHFRHGIGCYRLDRYLEAQEHLETARRLWESKDQNIAMVLLYEAMCRAKQNQQELAYRILDQARQAYSQAGLKYREKNTRQLSDLLWEAERVVGNATTGG